MLREMARRCHVIGILDPQPDPMEMAQQGMTPGDGGYTQTDTGDSNAILQGPSVEQAEQGGPFGRYQALRRSFRRPREVRVRIE